MYYGFVFDKKKCLFIYEFDNAVVTEDLATIWVFVIIMMDHVED
jgi:hypothetical protein